jgi:hypothetical protein
MSALDTLNRQYPIRHFDDGGSTNDPVAGLYGSVFDRAPDAPGLEYWTNAYNTGTSLADIESAFRGSPEAQATGGGGGGFDANYYLASNPDVAQNWGGDAYSHYTQYGQSEGRAPSAPAAPSGGGDQFNFASPDFNAQAYIENAGGVYNPGSPATAQDIENLYTNVFNRAADQPGLEYWTQQAQQGASLSAIEQAFRASQEYQGLGDGGGNNFGSVTVTGAGPEFDTAAPVGPMFTDSQVAAYIRDNDLSGVELTNAISAFNITPEQLTNAQNLLKTNDPSISAASNAYTEAINQNPAADLENLEFYNPKTVAEINDWYQTNLDREADPAGLSYWSKAFGSTLDPNEIAELQKAPEYTNRQAIIGNYEKYFDRDPDAAGLQYFQEQLAAGRSLQDIERDIALSEESIKFNSPSVRAVLEANLGKDLTGGLTEDQIAAYTKVLLDPSRIIPSTQFADQNTFDSEYYLAKNPDVAAAVAQGIYATPYDHYVMYGFGEDRAANANPATQDERLREVFREIALDPVLGPKLREENPMLWEKVTPLERRPDEAIGTERIRAGDFGMVEVDGVRVPILNAQVPDRIFGGAKSGTISDFSHSRGNLTRDLGWTSNSFSNKIAKGADAFGVTVTEFPNYDSNGNIIEQQRSYQGLNEAANLFKIDPAQFADKQVQAVTPNDVYNEYGQLVEKGGQPAFDIDQNGNQVPRMQTITAQDQLYDAIGDAAKDYYLVTMDSLTPGAATEGGSKSFNTVLYQRSGDELIPITAPTSHGGYQNLDVYTGGSGFNFMRDIAPGIVFVGSAALAMVTAGQSLAANAAIQAGTMTAAQAAAAYPSVATMIGTSIGLGTGAAASIAGGVILGGAMGSLSAGASGGDPTMGGIAGAVTGGIANAMGPLMQSEAMSNSIRTAADASGGLYTPSQVANIVSSSFANAVGTAAGGASGDKIIKSFATALAANGISQGAVTGITEGLKGVFEPDTIAKIARASQILSNTVATSALTGKNPEQIAQSLITQFTNPSNLISAASSVATATGTQAPMDTGGRDQGATGFTTGAVDAELQRPIIIDEILASSKDPIASLNAINNWTGDQQANIQRVTQDMLQGGFSKPQIVDNLSAIYQVDTPTASALFQGIVASAAIDQIANNSKDPIAVFNAATMATGSKEDNLKFITSEMISQGLGKTEISKNLQDMYQIPPEKADAYAGQVLKTETAQPQAQNFGEAFSQARSSGAKQFEYEGKKYTTDLAPAKVAETESKIQAQQGAVSTAPSYSGLIEKTGAVPGLNSAIDAKLESTPFGPMPTSKAPSFYGQGAQTVARASTQQDISNFLNKAAPVQIDPADKSTLTAVADFYKDSLLGTGGQIIESIGNFRNYMAQVAVAHGIISPQNSFVLSSQAMQKFGDTMIPESLKQSQTQIVKDIDAADTVPGKIVAGLVSALENPRGASLFVGGALVEAGLPLIAGTAATAFTGLTAAGVGTMSLLQGAQSFGSRYEQVTNDLINKGVPEAQAREQAMLPSYVSGLITAIVSPIANVPLIRSITSTPGTDIVLRSVTGAAAAKIIEKSVPVFMASSVSKDFASDYLDSLLGNMATDLIQTGTINSAKYQSEAVLEGLIGVGANTAIKAPFAVANMIPAASDSTVQQRPELNEYVIPQLGYTPTTEAKAIGYTPQASPNAPVETVVDTRNTAAQDLLDNLDIDPGTAVKLANNSVGSETINAMNSESSGTTPNINPDAVIVEDAFGNFITYADAIGAIVTESPIIDTKTGTREQQIQNEDLLQNVYGALNINPQAMPAEQTQPEGQQTTFKERPTITDSIFGNNIFGEPADTAVKYHPNVEKGLAEGLIDPDDAQWMSDFADTSGDSRAETSTSDNMKDMSQKMQNYVGRMERGEISIPRHMANEVKLGGNLSGLNPDPTTQTDTAVKMSTATDTATANNLTQKLETKTVTKNDVAIATKLVTKIKTAIDTATDIATKTQLQTDLDIATQIAQKIAENVRITSPVDTNVPTDTDTNVNVDVNVPVTPQVSTVTPESKREPRRPSNVVPFRRAQKLIEDETGIYDLGPAFTRARTNYQLAGQFGMATGGAVASQYDPFGIAKYTGPNSGVLGGNSIFDPKSPFVGSDLKMPKLTVGTTKKKLNYELPGYPGLAQTSLNYAEGGGVEHNPQFFSEGGLGTLENRYVEGNGDGTSDEVPAMLANGEFVIPADVVSSLGNGSNEAGASVLDQLLQVIREHRQDHNPEDLPPDSAGPLAYLLEAKKRA